jgi:hypothetical protein
MQVPKIIITLSTVPGRLIDQYIDTGAQSCIRSLCEQDYDGNYEVHFNIPPIYKLHDIEYIIPEWLEKCIEEYPHLKIFRPEDIGPSTKVVPTLERETDPETIIIVADDDLVYHPKMVSEHVKHQLEHDYACGYDGLSNRHESFRFGDVRDHYVVSIDRDIPVNIMQHYKTVSYKRKWFEQDFWDDFLGKTLSDDIFFSAYMNYKGITKMVMTYEGEEQIKNIEEWQTRGGVTTFPVLRHTSHNPYLGCNDPKHGPRFEIPQDFIDKNII